MFKRKQFASGLLAVTLLISLFVPLATAAEPTKDADSDDKKASTSKAPVTQSYGTDSTLQPGMIVRLNAKDESKVDPLRQDQNEHMFGVIVAANDAALSLTSDTSKRQVYVATYGKHEVLVSTQNGSIAKGDYIGISTIDGVGMKADDKGKTVIGKALANFSSNSEVKGTATLTGTDGKKVEVSLGKISVEVTVQSNPLQSVALPMAFTNFLSSIGYSVSNKYVNPVRLYLSLLVLLIASLVSGLLLLSGVKSAMTAIGRNPLAKKAIYRSLVQVVISSLIVFIIGIFAVYLLLKL